MSVGKPLYCFLLWPETDTRDLKRENMSLFCNENNIDVVPKTSHCNYVLRYVASFPLIPVTPFPYGDSPLKRESAESTGDTEKDTNQKELSPFKGDERNEALAK